LIPLSSPLVGLPGQFLTVFGWSLLRCFRLLLPRAAVRLVAAGRVAAACCWTLAAARLLLAARSCWLLLLPLFTAPFLQLQVAALLGDQGVQDQLLVQVSLT
jgi:hypothetical protein